MRIAYDKESHGLVVEFGGGKSYATSREVAPGVVVDFDPEDQPIALELEDVRGILDEKDIEAITAPTIARGADLAKFRAQLGLTQDRLAEILEVPRNTIARWERDELTIEKSRMLALALAAIAGASRDPADPRRRNVRASAVAATTRHRDSPYRHHSGKTQAGYRDSVTAQFVTSDQAAKHSKTVERGKPAKKK